MLKRIHWPTLIRALMDEAGLLQKDIGAQVGLSQPVVSRLSNPANDVEREPSHSEGEALKALFARSFPGREFPLVATPETPAALPAKESCDASA